MTAESIQRLDTLICGPSRVLATVWLEHWRAVNAIQIRSAEACTRLVLAELRNTTQRATSADALPDEFQHQADTARALSEQIGDDAQRLTEANEALARTTGTVAQDSLLSVGTAARDIAVTAIDEHGVSQ